MAPQVSPIGCHAGGGRAWLTIGILPVEHIIELNTIARFFTAAISGTLLSGGKFKTPALDSSITDTLRSEFQSGLDPVAGNIELNSPMGRIFNALGSTANTRTFVMAQAGVNFAKTAVRAFADPHVL